MEWNQGQGGKIYSEKGKEKHLWIQLPGSRNVVGIFPCWARRCQQLIYCGTGRNDSKQSDQDEKKKEREEK